MRFLNPIWLLASAAVLIPVLVHLWNTRKSKSLQVGSIAFFEEASEKKSWQKRISDPLLLLVRSLLLILLALLLAKPFWKSDSGATKEKGWVLLGKEDLPFIYKEFQPAIDSLIKAGFETRYFSPGFPPLNIAAAIKDSTHPGTAVSYWAIAAAVSQQQPADFPVYIFTNNKLKNFYGPKTRGIQNWFLCNTRGTVHQNVAAWLTPGDSIIVQSLFSDSSSLTYAENIVGQPPANLKMDSVNLRVAIVNDPGKPDGVYIKSALEAISRYGKRRIKIIPENELRTEAKADWLFWLKQEPPPPMPSARNIFYYDTGKIFSCSSQIIADQLMDDNIKLYQVIGNGNASIADRVLMKDGFGHPLLKSRVENETTKYCFNTRFDPAFNDLPWSAELPRFLYQLMYADQTVNSSPFDMRTMDAGQLKFDQAETKRAGAILSRFTDTSDLSKYFWMAVFVLFMLERVLSFFKQKNRLHAN